MITDRANTRLLVVDDELGMRDLLSTELGGQGYQVVVASNGQEALDTMQGQKFDLVITDLMMPKMDGLTLLENLKSLDAELEVILATGHGTVESAVSAMKKGAYDFILKPYNLDELTNMVEKALEKKKLKTMVALYEASNAVFTTIELDSLLEIILERMEKVLGADEASVMLLNEQNKLAIAAGRGLSDEVSPEVQLEMGERIAGVVAQEKQAKLLINGLDKYSEFQGLTTNTRIKSSIVCPLLCQGELLGILNLNRTKNQTNFNFHDLQSATVFASQAALAIQNAKLYHNLKSTQAELVQSEKLAGIGRLIAGVAHELNNPLTSVIGFSQLALGSHDIQEIHQHLPIIHSQALRCNAIVRDLLLFARRKKPSYQCVDPCCLIEETVRGLGIELEKGKINVRKDFPASPVSFYADPKLLQQVFTNILVNACQVLERISHERMIEIKVRAAGDRLQLSFKDNGLGIPKEILPKIFDPFYTTKEIGKGTGLGLSLSYGIVKDHGGVISVESVLGKETVFFIDLPLKGNGEMAQTPTERPKEAHFRLPAGSKILVVEDDEPIRKLIATFFENQNYKLDTAFDGEVALDMLKKQDYDIVLCDYRMPKLDGIELFKKIQALKPKQADHFLFITGSTEFVKNFDSFFKGSSAISLLKPFSRIELVVAVNSMTKSEVLNHENAS